MIPIDPTLLMDTVMVYASDYPTVTKVITFLIVFPVTPTLLFLYGVWKSLVRR